MSERRESTVVVPVYQDQEFWKKLASLNKKALSFGLEPVEIAGKTQVFYAVRNEYSDDGEAVETFWRRLGEGELVNEKERIVETGHYALDYPLVKLGDWRVVATLESMIQSDAEGGNLVFSVSTVPEDVEAAEAYRNCPIGCDHCNTSRKRQQGYVLADQEGNYKQVGSTCLEDFTGIDPSAVLFLARLYDFQRLYDMDSEGWGGGWRPTAVDTITYVSDVLYCIEQWGFVSATKARENPELSPTYQDAWSLESYFKDASRDVLQAYLDRVPERHAVAEQVIERYRAIENATGFDANVKALLSSKMLSLDRKHLAFVAGAVGAFLRENAKQAEPVRPSEHVGKVGDKIVGALAVRSPVVHWDTIYGRSYRVNLRDEVGNLLTWKTSNPPDELCWSESIGRKFQGTFKVKAHDEYKDRLVTEVSLLKFKSWIDEPEMQAEDEKHRSLVVWVERMDTAAFTDIGPAQELSNVLMRAADKVPAARDGGIVFHLYDTNGVVVGFVDYVDADTSLGDVRQGEMRVVIDAPASVTDLAVEGLKQVAAAVRGGMDGDWPLEAQGLRYGTAMLNRPEVEAESVVHADDAQAMKSI